MGACSGGKSAPLVRCPVLFSAGTIWPDSDSPVLRTWVAIKPGILPRPFRILRASEVKTAALRSREVVLRKVRCVLFQRAARGTIKPTYTLGILPIKSLSQLPFVIEKHHAEKAGKIREFVTIVRVPNGIWRNQVPEIQRKEY